MLRDVLIRLIISALGILIGISAFFVLFVGYGNVDVGFWSILSGTLAAVCFNLHWVKGKETLEIWHSSTSLRNLNLVGFISAVAGVTALIWYLFLTFYYKIRDWSLCWYKIFFIIVAIQPISDSTVICAVWAVIYGKWGLTLMYYTNKYELSLQEATASILTESA